MNKNTLSTFSIIVFACFSFSSIVFASGGKGLSDAVAIIPNTSLSLNFEDAYNDDDYFKIDLLTATDLTASNNDYRGSVTILDSQGNYITANNTYNNIYSASAYLEQGSYYIKLHHSCNEYCNSNYKLSVSVSYAPFNISPIAEESLIDTRTPNYHWTMVDGATSYQLNITPNEFKNDYIIPVDITKYCNIQRGECQITPRDAYLPDATSVKWHITAKDSLNKDMVLSDNTNFTVSNSYIIEKPLANINSAQIMGHCLFGSYCKRTKLTSAHNGVDFMTKSGTPVYAICDGVVKVVKPSSTSINNRFTVIEHTCTGINGKLYAYYGHINPESGVKVGDKVTKGKLIGKVGYFKDGQYDNSHLHLSLATKYFSSGWGYVDIGKTTLSDCEQSSVKTRRDSLIVKSWIDPASFGSAVGWGTFFLKGGASGKCNAQTQNDFPYPVGNLLPYYPFK